MAKETIQERESKTDIAYRILKKKKKEVGFYELWEAVKKELAKELSPEQLEHIDEDISFFYTNLTLDGRFFQLGDNKWNLRERIKYEDVKKRIEMTELYSEEAQDEAEGIQEEEQETYDNYDENDSYDDSTGSDADIIQYRERGKENEEEDEF